METPPEPHPEEIGHAEIDHEPTICLLHAENRAELFRAALESLAEGILVTDLKSRVIFANRRFAELSGYTVDEMIGQVSYRLLADPADWSLQEARNRARFAGEMDEYESQLVCKDGRRRWTRVRATPYRDATGRVVGSVGALTCIEQEKRLEAANASLSASLLGEQDGMVGQSEGLMRVLNQVHLVAATEVAVLIQGESGVGKEAVAYALHQGSERREGPLIRVNCASIPKELFESEFFGHVKGAFTGAVRDRIGRFELADGGTLLLDEIGEIPLELQSKLLRVLQEGQYERVGEERTRRVDVRVVAATNRNLVAEVEAGRFRGDLYYRLSVFPITVPPLRERREDIPPLVAHFIGRAAKRLGCKVPRLAEAQLGALGHYDWPGNIRELQNVIERAVILAKGGGVLRFDLPGRIAVPRPSAEASPRRSQESLESLSDLKLAERTLMINALRDANGRVYGAEGAAARLGIKPTTLLSRLKRERIIATQYRTL